MPTATTAPCEFASGAWTQTYSPSIVCMVVGQTSSDRTVGVASGPTLTYTCLGRPGGAGEVPGRPVAALSCRVMSDAPPPTHQPLPILATKLFAPPPRERLVHRSRLAVLLDGAPECNLTLVSAQAGAGKTTLVAEWARRRGCPTAWLSLDEGDGDVERFLAYLVAAVRSVAPEVGTGALALLAMPQAPPAEVVLTSLINELAASPTELTLVLDDYHLIDSIPVDAALAFLVEHLPRQLHLVVATRQDPALPLARLRACGRLHEVRAADLRFTNEEAAGFLNEVMGLDLSAEEVEALEARTEGWIAGLQLAAVSVRGRDDAAAFIKSFTGSHRFVLDYLVQEVLSRQPQDVQGFLLATSVLDRMCGPLCEAVAGAGEPSGQSTLEALDRGNLFLVALDSERRWYRYHHLFRDLLRKRASDALGPVRLAELHVRASQWFEAGGLDLEAFEQAAAGGDVGRAERLIEGRGLPLYLRGAIGPIIRWLSTLPKATLDARPSLYATYATVLLGSGRTTGIEEMLRAAEGAVGPEPLDEASRDLLGRIASTRALLAVSHHDIETAIAQTRRSLDLLSPSNLPFRTGSLGLLAYAWQFKGERAASRGAYVEALGGARASRSTINEIMALLGLGRLQEQDNELSEAAETHRQALEAAEGLPFPVVSEAFSGLARIHYQWNELDAAEQALDRATPLARLLENTDRAVVCEIIAAQIAAARGDLPEAAAILARADDAVRSHGFHMQGPDVVAARILLMLRMGDVAGAAALAEGGEGPPLPRSLARVYLAKGDARGAVAVLEAFQDQVREKAWVDAQLEATVLLALAFDAAGDRERALASLAEALAMAEPGGFVRLFLDEGVPMANLLAEAMSAGLRPGYVDRLLSAFEAAEAGAVADDRARIAGGARLEAAVETLSRRELEVLALIAEGLTNQEIAARLFLSLHTVKVHVRNIAGKLGAANRTQAVALARGRGLLPDR
jgi:LuxR family maltose regulon positive regulatory protein